MEHLGCRQHGFVCVHVCVCVCVCVCVSVPLSNQCEDKTNTLKKNELRAAGHKLPDDFISVHIW